ncbi:MAG: hypothetical protein EHM57_00840 [Actinobacteria bacterium]|nr:MAG: hypothetical protein EHM57_00840 [Actinomycetota bacterium]
MALNFHELEESISRLDSVDAARIVADSGRIAEVHIIAAPEKPAKQVVRDVQSLAMARYGTQIDRRVISVVQIAPDKMPAAIGRDQVARAALVDLSEEPTGTRTTIKVTLRYGDQDRTGIATGPAVASARLRLIGEATINAVEQTFDGATPIALDAVAVMPVGSQRVVAAVAASAGLGGREELSVGSALSNGDDGEAAVKAVLDALNRRLARSNG